MAIENVNLGIKYAGAKHHFKIAVRDKDHFENIVQWMNDNVGKGRSFWRMDKGVLKLLHKGKIVNARVFVYVDSFDETTPLYLNLI